MVFFCTPPKIKNEGSKVTGLNLTKTLGFSILQVLDSCQFSFNKSDSQIIHIRDFLKYLSIFKIFGNSTDRKSQKIVANLTRMAF